MDETSEDTLWSDAARERYVRCADDLIAALKAHVAMNVERTGRQRELEPYFASSEGLEKAAGSFNEAEFDWCGSFPLRLIDDEIDEIDDEDEADENPQPASVVSGLFRWDFAVTEEAAVIAAGRDAYRRAWPSDTDEDAELAVPDIERAAAEIIHLEGWSALEDTPGWERRAEWWTFVRHDGETEPGDDEDPFAIGRN
jgi:hypothetical protein